MVKKGQGSGGGGGNGGKPKKQPASVNETDGPAKFSKSKSSKPDAKPGKEKASTGNESKTSTAETGAASEALEIAPKRPDTRTLIGGASWTGKLPVTLLSEHCQKQKWERPEYTMVRTVYGVLRELANDILETIQRGLLVRCHPKIQEPKDWGDDDSTCHCAATKPQASLVPADGGGSSSLCSYIYVVPRLQHAQRAYGPATEL